MPMCLHISEKQVFSQGGSYKIHITSYEPHHEKTGFCICEKCMCISAVELPRLIRTIVFHHLDSVISLASQSEI